MSDTAEHATVEPETAEGPIEADTGTPSRPRSSSQRRDEALAKVRHVRRSGAALARLGGHASSGRSSAAEAERMVAIMRDAMGVGLAATQLGSLRRLLVFQAGPDATPMALANPEIQWLSDDLATAEEGCLSLPGVVVDVERPLLRPRPRPRRRAASRSDRGVRARGAGAPARDRPPRRRPDPGPHRAGAAQGRDARPARGRRASRPSATRTAGARRRATRPATDAT